MVITIDKFVSTLRDILVQDVSEVIKINSQNYLFKISAEWHQLLYVNNFGMVMQFRSGNRSSKLLENLLLESETLLNGTKLRKKGDELLAIVEKRYISQLIFHNEKIIESIGRYFLIIEKCERIEKKSDKIFVLLLEKKEYVFEVKDGYNSANGTIDSILEIHFAINGDHQTEKIIGMSRINEIMAMLNFIYYLNITARGDITKSEINKILRL